MIKNYLFIAFRNLWRNKAVVAGFCLQDKHPLVGISISRGYCSLIAFITVSFQAVKAAIANPVKNLRTE